MQGQKEVDSDMVRATPCGPVDFGRGTGHRRQLRDAAQRAIWIGVARAARSARFPLRGTLRELRDACAGVHRPDSIRPTVLTPQDMGVPRVACRFCIMVEGGTT